MEVAEGCLWRLVKGLFSACALCIYELKSWQAAVEIAPMPDNHADPTANKK